jgi:hypothetical protein
MLDSIVEERGFQPRFGQTKDYEIVICCISAKQAALRSKRLVRSESGCLSGASGLHEDCCYIELDTIKVKLSIVMMSTLY